MRRPGNLSDAETVSPGAVRRAAFGIPAKWMGLPASIFGVPTKWLVMGGVAYCAAKHFKLV